jgi:hypothetical protein
MNGSIVGSPSMTYRQPGQEFRSTTIFRFATDNPLPALPH